MHRVQICLLIWILPLLWLIPARAAAQENPVRANDTPPVYLWPTDASDKLSSTFAETRAAHFHSALDIKTWGQEGYDVFATRSGTLHRIAIGPRGYGKVLYLRHDDGTFSVYAHLLAFEESVQQLADSIRMADYRFEIDREVDHLGIRFEAGEKIAVSGSTGIGPPHLHFELRDAADRPFNPLLTNLSVEDDIAPSFSSIALEPLSVESSIGGENRILTRRPTRRGSVYEFGTVRVSGPAGVAVNVFDRSNGVYNSYAVYRLKMWVDGEPVFESQVDRFSYDETAQMFIDRIYPLLQRDGAAYQRLWIADGNTLPFYLSREQHPGVLDLEDGRHEVRIEASDYYGNTSRARLTLEVTRQFPGRGFPDPPPGGGPVTVSADMLDPSAWDWNSDWIGFPREEAARVTIATADSAGVLQRGDRVLVDLKQNPRLFIRRNARSHTLLHRITPGTPSRVASTSHPGISARFPAGTFYDTVSVGLTVTEHAPDSVEIGVWPSQIPVRDDFRIRVPAEGIDLPEMALYEYDRRRNRFVHLELERESEGMLSAEATRMGMFLLARDTAAPTLTSPRVMRRADGRWVASVTLRDNLSGIDHTRSEFRVNGVRGIAEYDPGNDRLNYYLPGFQPAERMRLEVLVVDRAGNRTGQTFELNR